MYILWYCGHTTEPSEGIEQIPYLFFLHEPSNIWSMDGGTHGPTLHFRDITWSAHDNIYIRILQVDNVARIWCGGRVQEGVPIVERGVDETARTGNWPDYVVWWEAGKIMCCETGNNVSWWCHVNFKLPIKRRCNRKFGGIPKKKSCLFEFQDSAPSRRYAVGVAL
jgi:hypothetical protein